ncbi:MAG TPA: GGDEF domain-containing protein [Thermoanaerobaculaceae bacterium]|nr:GGDEF domain-containing protein [Thermoanaerobaculaceae bacterium]
MERGAAGWRVRVAVTGAILALLIGVAEYLTGQEVTFLIFYTLLIAAVGWRAGRSPALVVVAAASIGWVVSHAIGLGRSDVPILLWSWLNRTFIFLVAAVFSDLLSHQMVLAQTDPLTNLPNRRALLNRLKATLFRGARVRTSISLAYIDLDNFKAINDRFGHGVGDTVLQRIGETIRVTIRAGDLPARVGGDEFVVVFWRLPKKDSLRIARRLVRRITELGEQYQGADLGASIGVASFERLPDRPEAMLEEADRALREAKKTGKGQVVWRETLTGETEAGLSAASRS